MKGTLFYKYLGLKDTCGNSIVTVYEFDYVITF